MLLPLESVAVHFTILFPKSKVAGALFVTVTSEHLSKDDGVPKEVEAAPQDESALRTKSDGATSVGLVLSITVTVKLQVCVKLFTSLIV